MQLDHLRQESKKPKRNLRKRTVRGNVPVFLRVRPFFDGFPNLTPLQPQPGHRTSNTRIASYANPQRLHALAMPRRSAHPTVLRLPPLAVRAAIMNVCTRQDAAKRGPHLLLRTGELGKQRNDRGCTLPSAVLCKLRSKLARGKEKRRDRHD
jgi:hypothetical protein